MKIRQLKKYILIGVLIMYASPDAFGFPGQGFNKATKKDEIIFISTEKEKKIGAKLSKSVLKKYALTDDPLIQKRIEKIGKKLADVCERKDIQYKFYVIKAEKDDLYNAFALPGGYIYIFNTFVEKLETDSKVAAILAHEIAHVAAKHSIKQLQSSLGTTFLKLLGLAVADNGRELRRANIALNQLMMEYSREAELEADKLSVRYMKNAGYDPISVYDVLKMQYQLRKKGPIYKYRFYRTHPHISERLSYVKTETSGKTDFDSYINITAESGY